MSTQAAPEIGLLRQAVDAIGRSNVSRLTLAANRPVEILTRRGTMLRLEAPSGDDLLRALNGSAEILVDELRDGDRLVRSSTIRDAHGAVMGLVVRFVPPAAGVAGCIADLLQARENVLVAGRSGSAITELLFDAARLLAEDPALAVAVLDTLGEFGGDGHVSQAALGRALPLAPPSPGAPPQMLLANVLQLAPDALVVSRIASQDEATALHLIALQGIQIVVGLPVGRLKDCLAWPPSYPLLGLRAEPAGGPLLRRVARPIAQHAVEVFPHDTVAVHSDLAASVEALLAGRTPVVDLREINRGPAFCTQAPGA